MPIDCDIVDRALLECLWGGPEHPPPAADVRRLSEDQWRELVARCKAQRVGPIVYQRLTTAGLSAKPPSDVLQTLQRRYRSNAIRNLWLQEALHAAVTACRGAGIEMIVLKGAHLAAHVYDNPALREMGDVDLLVRRAQLDTALGALQAAGFRSSTPMPHDIAERVDHSKHVPRLERGKAALELHWTIFPPSWGETTEIDGVWSRAVPTRIAQVDTRALGLEDSLLYLCGHAAYDHRFEFGLRPLCDLDRLIRREGHGVDWPTVIERAGTWGRQRGVYLALRLAADLMRTPVPGAVLRQMDTGAASPDVVATAVRMLFTDPSHSRALHLNVVRWHRLSLRGRLRLFYDRLRWCPDQQDPTLRYYVRHIPSLLLRHLPNVFRLLAGDRSTRQLADRKRTLAAWLEQGDAPTGLPS
jgi:hypothetical protein